MSDDLDSELREAMQELAHINPKAYNYILFRTHNILAWHMLNKASHRLEVRATFLGGLIIFPFLFLFSAGSHK